MIVPFVISTSYLIFLFLRLRDSVVPEYFLGRKYLWETFPKYSLLHSVFVVFGNLCVSIWRLSTVGGKTFFSRNSRERVFLSSLFFDLLQLRGISVKWRGEERKECWKVGHLNRALQLQAEIKKPVTFERFAFFAFVRAPSQRRKFPNTFQFFEIFCSTVQSVTCRNW